MKVRTGFLRHWSPIFDIIFSILDLFVILVSFLVVHRLYLDDLDVAPQRMVVLLVLLLVTYTTFVIFGVHRSQRYTPFSTEVVRITLCFSFAVLVAGLFAFLSKLAGDVSRFWFGSSALVSLLALVGLRIVVRFLLAALRKQGYNFRRIVIAGTKPSIKQIIEKIRSENQLGIKLTGVFCDDYRNGDSEIEYSGRLSETARFVEKMRQQGTPIDQVWIALPLAQEYETGSLMKAMNDSAVEVCYIPGVFGQQLLSGSLNQVGGLTLVNLSEERITTIEEWIKAVFDYVFGSVALILFSPLMFIISILIKLDSPGAVIFKQRRYGADGREIEVWKFRTMTVTEDDEMVKQVTAGDPRVTRVGRLLRKTSLDELPQILNVLQGRMSIVGPRPHAVSHNEEYRRKIDGYMIRHRVKPGITGWAQVNGWRGETDTLEKMEKRVEFDLEYLRNWSFWFDIKIILLTLLRGFGGKNAY